jgi:hypothetical protein
MSFFNIKEKVTGSFESGGGNFDPIPDGTQVLASCDEAKIDNYQGDDYISLRWSVLAPVEYKNRKLFQKVKVFSDDQKIAEKAKRMLAAIDANAGGLLMASDDEPTGESLTKALVNKPMILRLAVWDIEGKKGNWVSAVAPKTATSSAPAAAPAKAKKPEIELGDVPF